MQTWLRPLVLVATLLILGGLALLLVGVRSGGVLGLVLVVVALLLFALPATLVWYLHQRDTSGWLITWDVFEPLQFCAYVGHKLGFALADNQVPQTHLEREWQQWWDRLTSDTFDYQASLETSLRMNADVAPDQLIHLIQAPRTLAYDPPLFDSLIDSPTLRTRCQEEWPEFTALWVLEKPVLFTKLRRQGVRVRDNRLVRAAARAMGMAEVRPFFLRIDFVRWPEVYQRQRSPHHLVLGTHYLEASGAKALEDMILHAVRGLI